MRFLVSRRWLGFFMVVALLAFGAVRLGDWQFHRLTERREANRTIVTNLKAPPLPIAQVLKVGKGADPRDEWRQVTASGAWDDEHTVVIRYRTRDGASGVDVVTPLVTGNGTGILVDRGWLASDNNGSVRPKLPAATSGQVTVTGYVRVDATGGATRVDQLSARAISSRAIGGKLSYPVYGGFLELRAQTPSAGDRLASVELPEIDDGPHFFYGLQWWFFGFLAVVGFLYLAYDEWRQSRTRRPGSRGPGVAAPDAPGPDSRGPDSQGPEHRPVDRDHHAAHE